MVMMPDPFSIGGVNSAANAKVAYDKKGDKGLEEQKKKEAEQRKNQASRGGISPYSSYAVNRSSLLKSAYDKGGEKGLKDFLEKEKKDHPEYAAEANKTEKKEDTTTTNTGR